MPMQVSRFEPEPVPSDPKPARSDPKFQRFEPVPVGAPDFNIGEGWVEEDSGLWSHESGDWLFFWDDQVYVHVPTQKRFSKAFRVPEASDLNAVEVEQEPMQEPDDQRPLSKNEPEGPTTTTTTSRPKDLGRIRWF